MSSVEIFLAFQHDLCSRNALSCIRGTITLGTTFRRIPWPHSLGMCCRWEAPSASEKSRKQQGFWRQNKLAFLWRLQQASAASSGVVEVSWSYCLPDITTLPFLIFQCLQQFCKPSPSTLSLSAWNISSGSFYCITWISTVADTAVTEIWGREGVKQSYSGGWYIIHIKASLLCWKEDKFLEF